MFYPGHLTTYSNAFFKILQCVCAGAFDGVPTFSSDFDKGLCLSGFGLYFPEEVIFNVVDLDKKVNIATFCSLLVYQYEVCTYMYIHA